MDKKTRIEIWESVHNSINEKNDYICFILMEEFRIRHIHEECTYSIGCFEVNLGDIFPEFEKYKPNECDVDWSFPECGWFGQVCNDPQKDEISWKKRKKVVREIIKDLKQLP